MPIPIAIVSLITNGATRIQQGKGGKDSTLSLTLFEKYYGLI
jgi:hypothetical protein